MRSPAVVAVAATLALVAGCGDDEVARVAQTPTATRPDAYARARDAAAGDPADHRRQRRPAPASAGRRPRARAGRRERLRLPAAAAADPPLGAAQRAGVLPRRDPADARAARRLPAIQLPAGARARGQGHGLRRVQHRLEPFGRPRAGGHRRHSAVTEARRRAAHRLVLLAPAATAPAPAPCARRPHRLPLVHPDDERDPVAALVVGEPRERRADPARRPPRAPAGARVRDREPALGHRVPARAGRLPAQARPATGPLARHHRGGRPARTRRPADPARRPHLGRVRHRQPALGPDRRMLRARGPGRHARAPSSSRRPAEGACRPRHVHADLGAPSRLQGHARRPRPARVVAAHGRGRRP